LQDDIERGADDFALQTRSYGKFLIGVIERANDPARLKAYGRGFGESAKHALRAMELGLIATDSDDAWDIRKAILYAHIKDDKQAYRLCISAQANAALSWDDHKRIVREANAAPGAAKAKPESLKSLFERIDKALPMYMTFELRYGLVGNAPTWIATLDDGAHTIQQFGETRQVTLTKLLNELL